MTKVRLQMSRRIRCMKCNTPMCQLETTENWYCPKCRKWYVLSMSRTRTYISNPKKRPKKYGHSQQGLL